jgi:hypothetical protein
MAATAATSRPTAPMAWLSRPASGTSVAARGPRTLIVATDFLVEVAVPDLAAYEQLLLGQILTIPSVVEAQSTFAIRTILSRARCRWTTGGASPAWLTEVERAVRAVRRGGEGRGIPSRGTRAAGPG